MSRHTLKSAGRAERLEPVCDSQNATWPTDGAQTETGNKNARPSGNSDRAPIDHHSEPGMYCPAGDLAMQHEPQGAAARAWWDWLDSGASATEIEVLIREGFTIEQPPTTKEWVQVRRMAAMLERQ